ncbi:MAG: alpha/beta hydrolase [Candidatus Eremiobacteraeota bacterium]|nr:alpha/beta hydrolase [Candidatus Eremiobacteraeota bacterium]
MRLSVVDFGNPDGGTALFLHGGAGHLLQWHNQLGYFSSRLRVVAYDMRGHGQSEAPNSSYWLKETVEDLEELVQRLQLPEQFYLVCHSYGGAVGTEFARRHPDRLSGLVLAATSGSIPLSFTVNYLLKLPDWMLGGVQRAIRNRISTPPHVLKKLVGSVLRWDGWEIYPEVPTPTLVIAGELDWLTRPESMRKMAELLPDSHYETIRFAGHMLQLERPDRCNRLLENFLVPHQRKTWRGSLPAQ